MTGERIRKIAGWIIAGLATVVLIGFLLGFVVSALWNWLMPDIFGLPTITYWQAVGLLVLAHILFKGHGSFHHKGSKDKKSKKHVCVTFGGNKTEATEEPGSPTAC